ncbi:MAG TPA: ATP/GTP-binding protein [Gemmataceae bacterium]|nr:ATP/GTP-binding protein [Gemmataceae bacterium]
MLIDFSVANFRSFGAEQTLNLVASGKLKDHGDHCIAVGDTGKSVLRSGVVYGANAAGKSNLVRAVLFAQGFIQGSIPFARLTLDHFRFSKKKKPSTFEFRYLVDGRLFVYGFSITATEVVEEWLDATSATGRDVNVFSRKGQEISIGNLKPFSSDGEGSAKALKAMKLLPARADQLLLNKIVDQPQSHRGELLNRAVWWFTDCLTVIQADSSFQPLIEFVNQEGGFRHFAGAFLHHVGTGINYLHVERSEIDAEKIPTELLQGLQAPKGHETRIVLSPGVSLQLDPKDPTKVVRSNLTARHQVKKSDYSIPFQDESDGTQRCLNLLPALYHLTTGRKVFVIDEIDRSLHPLLCHALLKLFVESCPGACQQMIVTTHETHLLDLKLLRRDEIWFVEKDDKQQTQVYSLADLKVRNDVRIEKGYLQGRFGGIPFIGDTKRLMDMIQSPTDGNANAKKTTS